jgi:hypothetical protein
MGHDTGWMTVPTLNGRYRCPPRRPAADGAPSNHGGAQGEQQRRTLRPRTAAACQAAYSAKRHTVPIGCMISVQRTTPCGRRCTYRCPLRVAMNQAAYGTHRRTAPNGVRHQSVCGAIQLATSNGVRSADCAKRRVSPGRRRSAKRCPCPRQSAKRRTAAIGVWPKRPKHPSHRCTISGGRAVEEPMRQTVRVTVPLRAPKCRATYCAQRHTAPIGIRSVGSGGASPHGRRCAQRYTLRAAKNQAAYGTHRRMAPIGARHQSAYSRRRAPNGERGQSTDGVLSGAPYDS